MLAHLMLTKDYYGSDKTHRKCTAQVTFMDDTEDVHLTPSLKYDFLIVGIAQTKR